MAQQIDIVANLIMKVDNAEAGVNKLKSSLSKLKLPSNIDTDLKKSFSNLDGLFAKYKAQLKDGFNTKTDVSNFTKTAKQINNEYDRITKRINQLNNTNVTLNVKTDAIKEAEKVLNSIIEKKKQASESTKNTISADLAAVTKAGSRSTKAKDYSSQLSTALNTGDMTTALEMAQKLRTQMVDLKSAQDAWAKSGASSTLPATLDRIVEACKKGSQGFDLLEKEEKEAVQALANLQAGDLEKINQILSGSVGSWEQETSAIKTASAEMEQFARSSQSMSQQLGDLQQSTQYFFSLRNMINLLRRGIDQAIDTVKELDAAMTETAVVTDFSVSDMWEKLPEYTANANALGASVKDMYEATTLYYQQGLDTEAAMGIANETMKMARIGGLEASDATDKMTAALRGFNMELNETSAQRVNDVYSNLAAKTASDTEELGTAMQRTASIAASAGMSFEGTAAFLAQAIETTREPAENLGTAMKTIVARFTELKKNPLEIAEVDGEEVSYNKVDTALQSIGVSLKDANGQFRDLDQVFLDISQRWNSLSQTQQRYIATIAAGSRQQSRFIAMMSNYDRTVQLMDYANNSAGASNEQFGKTMESLEAKLNKLQNAWNEFLMGIANSSFIKTAVDGLTDLIGNVNELIDTLSLGSGGLKSFLSIFAAFKGLQLGGRLINKLIGGVGGFIDPTSSFGKGFWNAGKTDQNGNSAGLAGKISTPIVAKLNELIAVTKTNKNIPTQTNKVSTVEDYKRAMSTLYSKTPTTIGTINSTLGSLSDEHAYAAYKNAPGTVDAMRQAALGWLGSKKMPTDAQKTGQQLMNGIFKGMSKKEISIKDGMKLMGKPALWGEYFGTDVAKNFSQQYVEQFKAQVPQMREKTQTALQQTWQQLLGNNANNKAMQQGFLASQAGKDKFITAFKNNRASLGIDQTEIQSVPVAQTKYQQLANTVGTLGSKFSTAGMSLQMFGAQLGQLSPALQGVGAVISQVGMAINTFGMGISGFGSVIPKVVGRVAAAATAAKGAWAAGLTKATTANVFLGTLTGGMSAGAIGGILGVALVGGILIAKRIAEKKAKEAGEEIRNNFEEGYTKKGETIDSLEGYRDRFNELSKGVDQFGHNINLSDEDYNEYLSISRELKQLSPSLIAGYNAEGEAILKKGQALNQVIDKLKEERKEAAKTYTSDVSVDKLLKEYQTSDAYKNNKAKNKGKSADDRGEVSTAFENQKDKISKLNDSDLDFNLTDAINQLSGWNLTSLDSLSTEQLSWISQHYSDVIGLIEEENGQLDEKVKQGYIDAFSGAGAAIDEVMTEGQPIIDAMQIWMGDQKIDAVGLGLGEEFSSSFTQGFNSIMLKGLSEGWSSEVFKSNLQEYSQGWKQLGGATSEYSQILEEATGYQDQYLDAIGTSGAIETYQSNVEDLATQLENLAAEYEDTGDAGRAFAEQCVQQANALRNYATEGAVTLGEALNVLSGKFAEARGAKEKFDEATKGGDYYTAAEGFRSIADTVLDEKNSAGGGSLTAWTGAEQLLGQNFVDNAKNWEEVQKQVEKVNKLFDDGAEGVYNFNDMLVEAVKSGKDLKGLGEVEGDQFRFHFDASDVDNLKQYADLLGISEDVLAGMIDKSRQFAEFNVGDNKLIRQALEQSEQTFVGKTYGKNDKTNLYTAESTFRAEAYAQGIRGDDYTKTKKDLTKEQNVQFLTVESLKANKGDLGLDNVLKDIGLEGADKTLNNTVAALTKMGFNLEEQKDILKDRKLADGEATDEAIEKAYNENAYALENPTVAEISDKTGVIADAATAILASMGILTDDAKKKIADATNEKKNEELINNADQDYTTGAEYLKGTSNLRAQIEDNNNTIDLLKQGQEKVGADSERGQELQKEIDALEAANERLGQGLTDIDQKWAEKIKASQENLQNIGKTEEEQGLIDNFAVDISSMMNTENISDALLSLTSFEKAAGLSQTAVANLAREFVELRQTDLGQLTSGEIDALLTALGLTAEEAREVKAELQSPFRITTELTGADLENYINEVDGLTSGVKTIALNAQLSGEEKVSGIIDEINNTFGDGDTKKKTVIIEATSKLASGDKEGANKLLTDAFGAEKAEEITKQLSIVYDGSIANAGEVQSSLEGELDSIADNAGAKTREIAMNVKANVTTNFKEAKARDQQAKVNYKRGSQAEAKDSKAGVDYNKIIHQKEPEDGKAGVSYNYISYQKPPETKHAKVIYDDGGPHTGGFITTAGVLYRAKGGRAEWPGYPKKGTDRIPAYLSPGEYVQNRKAVDYFGIDFMRKINHRDLSGALQSFGSAAKGMNVPKSKIKESLTSQTTALVGEEGYEVGYIPSEQRSVIFGANGPEMTSFPSDTIIYPHKQSQEIIKRGKQKHSTAGSFVDGLLPSRSTGTTVVRNNKSNNKGSKGSDKLAKDLEVIIEKGGKVSVWWENMTRRIENNQRKVDSNQKKFEKLLKTFGKTAANAQDVAKDYKAYLNKSIKLNQAEVNKANSELKSLDKNGKASISYEVTKKKKGKKTKETKKATVNLGNYIKQEKDGTYVIDQKKLDKVAKKNKSKAEAIKTAAEQKINDKVSKKNKAQDEIDKAREALEKISNDIYQTFYAWERSITRVYLLSQKLDTLNKQLSIDSSKLDLQFAKIEAGAGTASQGLSKITTALADQRNNLLLKAEGSKEKVSATRQEFLDSMNLSSYLKKLGKNPDSTDAKNDYIAAKKALEILDKANLSGANFNYTAALNTINSQKADKAISKDEYDAIKGVLDGIFEKQGAYLDATSEGYQSITEIYQTMEEYQSFIAEFEESLLSGIEEQAENQIKHLDKLNSALTKAYKDLLDEVKRRLDERRKQEDNAKTESDISRKQQRLAMLRADTSGGHQTEIAQLEQEIAESQQNYQRTLEDQLLERLQHQGDEAEKQRQRQIELLEAQNQVAQETGANLAQVKEWLKNPEANYQQIRSAWLANHNYDEATPGQQKQLEEQFEVEWAKYQGYSAELKKYEEQTTYLKSLESKVDEIAKKIKLDGIRTVSEMKAAGISASTMKAAGYSAETLKKNGYTNKELFNAGYSKDALSKAGIKAKDLAKADITASQLQKRGYGLKETKRATGKTLKDMVKAGFTAKDFKADKYNAATAVNAGVKTADVAKVYGTAAMQATNKVTGLDVQKAKGTSAKTLQKAVNKSSKDKATQKDMAGVQVGTVDVNGGKKGGTVKDSHISSKGTTVGSNKGSTLYTADWDEKTGKVKGKWTAYTIDKLTAALIKKYPTDGKQALVYAIQHTKVGNKINKNMGDLVKAAGIAGKTYKLANGTTASIGGGGGIHYNGTKNKKDGVYLWNPATGKLSFREYKKNDFIKWAKDKNTGREYAAVLKKKKVKGYATGGIADYTGPAWLDGTPSKPELVLNATDTKNFLALKDVLSKAISSTGAVENTYGGDAMYEININVDKIEKDYDVDRVIDRVKKEITKGAGYRNVTQVRNFR